MKGLVLGVMAVAALTLTDGLRAQTAQPPAGAAPPDFSGVYYPANEGRGGAGRRGGPPPAGAQRGAPPPRPTQSAPLSDGSQGRSPDAPSLTPEYLAKWDVMRKSRIAGSYEYDNSAKCLPPGMPAMMNMAYGMEVMQTKDKITFFSELNDALRRVYLDGRKPTQKTLDDPTYAGYSTGHWEGDTLVVDTVALNDALRRVYLDGRKPTQKVLDDPTYAGYSTGHWEGDTLVVDTVALNDLTFIEGFTPHSTAMTVKERIRFNSAGLLEDHIVVTDPIALTKPWEVTRTYRRASPGNDQLREFACPEGLDPFAKK